MTYTKPEVNVLGSAIDSIEALIKNDDTVSDGSSFPPGPAYDLDE